ncbi:hypothetical protein E2C01_016240 [Portunus trituberculatus]|uniref:Uncharacterized protein n=1 Tax=Portunus trituberculatus TaxID=210409 RepID=A0A5B7DNW3_PORTR|nr:hypothetical protein [Portunus trituberculatus]
MEPHDYAWLSSVQMQLSLAGVRVVKGKSGRTTVRDGTKESVYSLDGTQRRRLRCPWWRSPSLLFLK